MRQAFLAAFVPLVPYVVSIIQLDVPTGIRVLGNLVGIEPDAIRAGLPVRAQFTVVDGITLVQWAPRS